MEPRLAKGLRKEKSAATGVGDRTPLLVFLLVFIEALTVLSSPIYHAGLPRSEFVSLFVQTLSEPKTLLIALLTACVGTVLMGDGGIWRLLRATLLFPVGPLAIMYVVGATLTHTLSQYMNLNLRPAAYAPMPEQFCTARDLAKAVFSLYGTDAPAAIFLAHRATRRYHEAIDHNESNGPLFDTNRPFIVDDGTEIAVVLLSGTEVAKERATGLDADVLTYTGFQSVFQRKIIADLMRLKKSRKQITAFIIGHSLGGMVAESLLEETDRVDSPVVVYQIMTFGSPILSLTAIPPPAELPMNHEPLDHYRRHWIPIVRFARSDDIVPRIPSIQYVFRFIQGGGAKHTFIRAFSDSKPESLFSQIIDSHLSYPNATDLDNYDSNGAPIIRASKPPSLPSGRGAGQSSALAMELQILQEQAYASYGIDCLKRVSDVDFIR